MNARESDPTHDDYNMTQQEFEQAATMNFPTITIPDPAAVGAWLDQEQPDISGPTRPTYGINGWCLVYWTGETHIVPLGATPEDLLASLRDKLKEHDPLAKLRKNAEAHGYVLMKLPTD